MGMTAHRPFSDVAGYMRHCWECVHAKDWEKRPVNGDRAMCDVTGAHVYRFDSPNNPCSHLPLACEYERRTK